MKNNISYFIIMSAAPWVIIPASTLSDNAHIMGNFFLALCAVLGTLLGVVLCFMSIFVSASSHRIINNMKKTLHYKTLIWNFKVASLYLFVSMIFSLVCYFTSNIWVWRISFSIFSWSLTYLAITGNRFLIVMSKLEKPEGNPNRLE